MKISVKPGKQDKIHIFIDDVYRLTVDDRFWFSERWHNLKEIDCEELAALEEAVGSRRAFNSALDFLSRRDHGKQELYRKLLRKHSKEAAQTAVEKAEELGLLDDERFAVHYAEELYTHKGYGGRRIMSALLEKGIAREIAENAVESLDKDDENRIIILLQKKYRSCLADEKGRRRAVNGLLRMGYGYSEIRKALEEIDLETEETYDA